MELNTNGGTLIVDQVADLELGPEEFIEVWFSCQVMTNMLSLALLTDRFCITFDSRMDSAFVIHSLQMLRFGRGPEHIYYY